LQLRLTATSFLLPGGAWKPLTDRHAVDFGAYGDWPAVLADPGQNSAITWVVFLDDLIGSEAAAAGHAETVLAPVLQLLDSFLARSPDKPLIVAWASPAAGSAIRDGKRPSWGRRLARQLEEALYTRAASCPALHILPLDEVFASAGRAQCYDSRNYYAARCRLSAVGLARLAESLSQVVDRIEQPARKVLVLDCDNTLWGGVVGEDGVAGLTLGQDGNGAAFADFQRVVRALAEQGTVLALASKNEERDVWEVFEKHPGMVLKREDFAAWRINWIEKAQNIAELAEDLGVGLDSLAFWDDNPIERAKVRAAVPQVHVFECPDQVINWPAALAASAEFARFELTAEDRRKTQLYKARAQFVTELNRETDQTGFLRSIALRPESLRIDAGGVARAAQLCAKTNQFNLRTVRHSAADLIRLGEDPRVVAFLTRLIDQFGDHGIVGLTIARPSAASDAALLDTFLISCRVLGRHLEAWMLDACVRQLRQRGYRRLIGEFVPSGRNGMASEFLVEHGMVPLSALPPEEAASNAAVVEGLARGGELYFADLHRFKIPYLDIYGDDQALARSA
jgi:FkbH-like protein